MTTPVPMLVVDPRSSAVRRRVGPLAWAVLEEAALSSSPPGSRGSPVCSVSVRTVAEQLGVGKAAAARAISVLVDVGVLIRLPPARGRDGRFDRCGYLLRLPEGIALSPTAASAKPVSGQPDTDKIGVAPAVGAGGGRKTASGARVGDVGQASLFDTSTTVRAPSLRSWSVAVGAGGVCWGGLVGWLRV